MYKLISECPICKSKDYIKRIILGPDKYLKKCMNCDTLYFNKAIKLSYNGYNQKYKIGNLKNIELKNNKLVLDLGLYFLRKDYLFYPLIKKRKGVVVDIGCGTAKYLQEYSKNGWDCIGVDTDKNIINYLNKNYRKDNLIFYATDTNHLDESKLKNKADVILFFYILEHMDNINFFKKISSLTKKGGKLYIMIPNGNGILAKIFDKYYYPWLFGQHIMFPSKKAMKYIEKYGFKLNKVVFVPDAMEVIGSTNNFLMNNSVNQESLIIKNKFLRILLNITLIPILFVLSFLGLGSKRYEFEKL